MKKLAAIVLALALSAAPALATNLGGGPLFNTNPFPCDGVSRVAKFDNNTGQPLFFKSISITTGLLYGQIADMQLIVLRSSDAAWLAMVGWDRYDNPNAPITKHYSFGPDWFEVAPTDHLWISYFCYGFTPDGAAKRDNIGHFVVHGTWTQGQP